LLAWPFSPILKSRYRLRTSTCQQLYQGHWSWLSTARGLTLSPEGFRQPQNATQKSSLALIWLVAYGPSGNQRSSTKSVLGDRISTIFAPECCGRSSRKPFESQTTQLWQWRRFRQY
jgi:hypothetical protein